MESGCYEREHHRRAAVEGQLHHKGVRAPQATKQRIASLESLALGSSKNVTVKLRICYYNGRYSNNDILTFLQN